VRFYSQQHNFALNIEEGSPGREANNWGFRGGGGEKWLFVLGKIFEKNYCF